MHPFLNTGKLSDEEIIEKLGKAYGYMNYQSSLGHTAAVISIKEVIETLEEERHVRMQKMIEEENKKKYPNSNKPIELGKIDSGETSI